MPSAAAAAVEITVGSGPEHLEQLVQLSRAVYGSHPDMDSRDYHRWLYLDGPCGSAIQASAFAGGRMVGHYAVVPLLFHDSHRESRAGLGVNAGHDLDLANLVMFRELPFLDEVSIGHAIMSRALFVGLPTVVREYLAVLVSTEGTAV